MKRYLDPGFFLIGIGVIGVAVSAFADFIGFGRPGFGTDQLSGLVVSTLVVAAGLVKVLFVDTRKLARVLAGIYVSGILFVGLRPYSFRATQSKILLNVRDLGWHDFAINIGGFIPLGYLFMLSLEARRKDQGEGSLLTRAILVAGGGGLISLFLEFSQYYLIPGRSSSLFDLIANTLGGLIGIMIYLVLEHTKNKHNNWIVESAVQTSQGDGKGKRECVASSA